MATVALQPVVTCAINVSDLDRAIAFYQDRLGFKLLYKLDDIGWCELETPVRGCTVGLSRAEGGWGPGGATLTWGVKDIDAARTSLEADGVAFDGPTQEIPGMVKLATFHDPDGNQVMLAQNLMEQS